MLPDPSNSARRWTRRRATQFSARLLLDPEVSGIVMRRVGLLRWSVSWALKEYGGDVDEQPARPRTVDVLEEVRSLAARLTSGGCFCGITIFEEELLARGWIHDIGGLWQEPPAVAGSR